MECSASLVGPSAKWAMISTLRSILIFVMLPGTTSRAMGCFYVLERRSPQLVPTGVPVADSSDSVSWMAPGDENGSNIEIRRFDLS